MQIPVLAFQETDVYDLHGAQTTSERSFRNSGSKNDLVWVAYGISDEYGALQGKLSRKLQGLFKICNTGNDGKVYRLAIVQLLQASQNGGGHIADVHGLVRVFAKRQKSETEFRIVDIATVTGQAPLILDGDGRWLVNSQVDLRTFNDIY